MGAFADLDEYVASLRGPRELQQFFKTALTTAAGRPYSSWGVAALNGATPTAAAVPTNATTGSLGQENAGSESLYCVGGCLSSSFGGHFVLHDRLSHQGGLSGIVTTAQTTNLPTAALTRYTSGDGVMAALQIYSQIGTTATTVSVSYTNQAGTSGRTSPPVAFGGTGNREVARLILIPLAAGDTGFRSVESVTVTATTGTAGAFGVVLFKPLQTFCMDTALGQVAFDLLSGGMIGMPDIPDNACLSWTYYPASTSTILGGELRFMAV